MIVTEDPREPPEYTREQEAAIEVAEREADESFARGDFECVRWLAEQGIDREGDDLLMLWWFVRTPHCTDPMGWGELPTNGFLALRARMRDAWREHRRNLKVGT